MKLSMYCLSLNPNHLKKIQAIDYIPVGLGDNFFNNSWISDKSGKSISSKNPYYGEYTFHYWIWKNYQDKIGDDWVGFCQYRKFWKKKISNEVIDTLTIARDKFPGSSISLDALCKRYRIDNSKRVQHTALIDCDLLAKVYINLTDQKEPTLNFKNEDNEKIIINLNDTKQYYKKVVKPSEIELKLHKEYLKNNLKKNFFN